MSSRKFQARAGGRPSADVETETETETETAIDSATETETWRGRVGEEITDLRHRPAEAIEFGDRAARRVHRTRDLIDWLDADENIVRVEYSIGGGRYKQEHTDYHYLSTEYTPTSRKTRDSQREVADAWARGEYPAHNADRNGDARLYSSRNYEAIQSLDGTGRIVHYSTIADIRTKSGLIVTNEQDYSRGGAIETHPREADAQLPLDALDTVLDAFAAEERALDGETIYDIVAVHRDTQIPRLRGRSDRQKRTQERQGAARLVLLNSGAGVVLLQDATHHSRGDLAAFALDAEELGSVATVGEAISLLTPTSIAGRTVVESNEIRSADDSRVGSVIQRQGEWFFRPLPELDTRELVEFPAPEEPGPETDGPTSAASPRVAKPSSGYEPQGSPTELGSHIPRDYGYTPDGTLVVRGSVRHRRGEHYLARLGETWHETVTHDRDVMTVDATSDITAGSRGGFD